MQGLNVGMLCLETHTEGVCCACSWQLRIQAMQTARRAYLKALHLAPQQGSLWGDLAATFYHEAQLRRAHPQLNPSKAKPLRAAAEKLMRGVATACLHHFHSKDKLLYESFDKLSFSSSCSQSTVGNSCLRRIKATSLQCLTYKHDMPWLHGHSIFAPAGERSKAVMRKCGACLDQTMGMQHEQQA